jgi:polar amino acid transport system ATP-binding protein
MTVRQNIRFPAERRRDLDEGYLAALIGRFGMSDFLDRFPNQVSLGQRQRAALVRALVLRPSYLLLDEITSALDVEQTAQILELLGELRDEGLGILIVTHLLGFARRAADHVGFLASGEMVEAGPASILEAPKSARLQRFLSILETAR